MKVFQPSATIENFLGARESRYSYNIYMSEDAAREAMPDFLKRLERRDDYDLGYADKVLETTVVELELVGFYIAM